jgi:hypothetical protein
MSVSYPPSKLFIAFLLPCTWFAATSFAADDLSAKCPKPAVQVQATCTEISHRDLPKGVSDLLAKMKCDAGSNYDYGSAVDLNGDGVPEYQVCCSYPPHGPCGSVLIGKVGSSWKELNAKEGLAGFTGACTLFIPLESQHSGFHDVCLPYQCSSATPGIGSTCAPTIWQFSNGRYRSVAYTPAKPAK